MTEKATAVTEEIEEEAPEPKESPEQLKRYGRIDPHQILSVVPTHMYHDIVDLGCGEGYFTVPFGKYLWDGVVHAVDWNKPALDKVREEIERVRLTNVEVSQAKGDKIPLDDESVDGAFIGFYLNEASKPKKLLEEAKRCLKKGGWIVALEWAKKEMEPGPELKQRIDAADLRTMIEDAGFKFTSRHDLNPRQYMLILRK